MLLRAVYRVVLTLVAGIILYSLAGFLLVPLLIERRLESAEPQNPSRRVAIDRVSFNPYTFRIGLTRTTLESSDGRRVATLPGIEAFLDAGSLLERDPVIKEMTIAGPDVLVTLNPVESERLPFTAGLAFLMNGVRALSPTRIDRLSLRGGSLRVGAAARSREAPAPTGEESVTDFEFEILDLDFAGSSPAPFTVNARLPGSATLEGRGAIAVAEQGFRLEGDFELVDIEIETPPAGKVVFRAPRVAALGVEIDSPTDAITVALLQVEQPELRLARRRSGQIELPEWLLRLASGSDAAVAAVDRIEISGGSALVADLTVEPAFSARIVAIEGVVRPRAGDLGGGPLGGGLRNDTGGKIRLTPNLWLEGRLPGTGIERVVSHWWHSDRRMFGHVDLSLTDIDLRLLSPYFRAMTDRGLDSGRLDLDLRADRDRKVARSLARLSMSNVILGNCDADFSHRQWPLKRAVSLLQDSNGRIELNLAGRAKETSPDAYWSAGLGEALRHHLTELSAQPFEALATLAGMPGQRLDRLSFEPGSAELTASARMRLNALGKVLAARPALGLKVLPTYDPGSDRDALADQQMRLHIALATSAGPPGRARRGPLDFNDSKVRVVLDEFAVERLSAATIAAVSARFPQTGEAYYQGIFDRLVANETVSTSALERLGSFRARSIADALTVAGIAESRLDQADEIEPVNKGSDAVFLPLELSIPVTDSEECIGSS